MSTIKCQGCGRDTNTTMCDWSMYADRKPRRCWATPDLENNVWLKGCGYDSLSNGSLEKIFADKHIGGKVWKTIEERLTELEEIIEKGR